MSPAWTAPRIVWALLGALALIAGGVGTYVSLRQDTRSTTRPLAIAAADVAPLIRMHASPRPLPEVAFADGAGKQRALSEFKGKFVLLNVWATWCPPCREEMPSLDRLQRQIGGPGFEVVALSIDTGGAAVVKRFYEEIGIRSLAVYVDPTMRATGKLATPGLPTTLLIDRQGREIGRHVGPAQWDGKEALDLVTKYLGQAVKPPRALSP